MDRIIVSGLKIRANHGVLAEEKQNGQYFYLDIILCVDLSRAEKSDALSDTVNYDEVCCTAIDAMTSNTFDLIERAAGEVISALFARFEPVTAIELTLKKPEAPLCGEVEYAAVSMFRERGSHEKGKTRMIFQNEKIMLEELTPDGVCTVYSADGQSVGRISLVRLADWQLDGIDFSTDEEFRRNGYAAAAVHAFTRWYYDNNSGDMLAAVVPLENVAAIRTLERAGYDYVRSTRLCADDGSEPELYHLYVCTRAEADAGAKPKGCCCCGCGGHAENEE